MSNSNNSSSLKPIEDILASLTPQKSSSISMSVTQPQSQSSFDINEDFTSTLTFKIIIILFGLLIGILAKIYLGKEIKEMIEKIQNYFETIKYHKKEEKELEKQEKEQKKEEKEDAKNKPKTTNEIIQDSQTAIKDNKKQYKKGSEPVGNSKSSLHGTAIEEEVEDHQKDALQRALDDAAKTNGEVAPDSSVSMIQSGNKGWCLIGSDNAFRSCAEIGINDVCMSGEIYPTQAVCINPKLRA